MKETRKVVGATLAHGRRGGLLSLCAAVFAAVWALSCGDSGVEPRAIGGVSLPLRVVFASSDSSGFSGADADVTGSPTDVLAEAANPRTSAAHAGTPAPQSALVSEIIARAFDLDDADTPRAVARTELTPSDTRFELALSVPPAMYYRIEVMANGTRTTGEGSTEFGLLYSGVGFAMDVDAGSRDTVEIVLDERVPRLEVVTFRDSYQVSWTRILDAVRYRLRETGPGGTVEWVIAGQDTSFAYPATAALGSLAPGDFAIGGDARTYRVAAVLSNGFISAFSEPVAVSLPGAVPPAAVTDLRAGSVGPTAVQLLWTAPGDDGESGTATGYELRRHAEPITDANFALATLVAGVPSPQPGGFEESFVVEGLEPEAQYHFALRAFDDVPLTSPLSNVISLTTLPTRDVVPPDPVTDLSVIVIDDTTVDLSWTASGDDGNTGRATRTDLRHAPFPITESNFEVATPIATSTPLDPGDTEQIRVTKLSSDAEHYFALRIFDEEDNASTLSNVALAVTPDSQPPDAITDLSAAALGEQRVTLLWTAPGDDGDLGTAAAYEIRYGLDPIDDTSWETARPVATPPIPQVAGSTDETVVGGLLRETTYYFVARARDNVGNLAPLSNIAVATTLDTIPPAPTGSLTAERLRETSVRLRWIAPGDDENSGQAAVYDVRFSTSEINAENFEQATNLTVPSPQPAGSNEDVILDGLPSRVTLYFALRTADTSANISSISNIANTSTSDTEPPGVITDITIIGIGNNSVTLRWTAPGDDDREGQATTYDLRYATFALNESNFDGGTAFSAPPAPGPAESVESVEVTGLAPETHYFFAIRTLDEAENRSAMSNVPDATTFPLAPAAPIELHAQGISDSAVELVWTDVATNEDRYLVERSEEGGPFDVVASKEGSFSGTVTHLDSGLVGLTSYTYRVRAENEGGFSGYSNRLDIRTSFGPPSNPVATPISSDSISVAWDYGMDPGTFHIERLDGPFGEWGEVAVIPGSERSYGSGALQPVTEYGFRIRAGVAGGLSGYSEETFATTLDLAPICSVDPPTIEFGDVLIGAKPDQSFTIKNVGGGILSGSVEAICSVQISILEGAGTFNLARNDPPHTVVVRFEPVVDGFDSCPISLGTECGQVLVTGSGVSTGTWFDGFSSPPVGNGVDGEVRAFRIFGDELAVGGSFLHAGLVTTPNVARWSGTSWGMYGSGLPGPVLAFGETFGQLIAGGTFEVGAGTLNRMARWNDPSDWEGFLLYPDGPVHAMYTFPDSVVVGGDFVNAIETPLNHVGVFYDFVFFPIETFGMPPGTDGTVSAITEFQGHLIVAGSFTSAGGTAASNIASWNGSIWEPLGFGVDGAVYALEVIGENLYVGGSFSMAGTSSARGVARWNGTNWSALDNSLGFSTVFALREFNGALYAGGDFVVEAPSGVLNRIAEWDGSTWEPLGSGLLDGEVFVLEEFLGSLYAGGTFTFAGGRESLRIARWDPHVTRP